MIRYISQRNYSYLTDNIEKSRNRGVYMQLLMIFSLLCMTALFVFTAFRLNEPETQPVRVKKNQR